MEKIILFMDNKQNFLEVHSRILEKEGYRVLRTSTLEEARKKLNECRVHLAILDIRMQDDDDPQDISGLLFAQQEEFRLIPKIILTGYPSYEHVREALGITPDGQQPAVNYLDKDEGPEALIQAVKKAFAQFVHINWNLDIQRDQREPLPFLHLASQVQGSLIDDVLLQRADELEDLFRWLFYDYQQIRIGRLVWHDRWRFCLPILARSPQGTTDSRLLVCGNRERVEQDRKKLEVLAPKATQGSKLSGTSETIHFGANTYELPGADIETVQTLRDMIHMGKERPLKTAFNYLLGDVLKAWHQHGQMVQKKDDLMSLYRQWAGLTEDYKSREEIEQRVDSLVQSVRSLGAIEIKLNHEQVMFHFPRQSPHRFPDPVATVYTPLAQCDAPVVCRISPGRLTTDNVLVDATQKTWLTDFALAGQAPQWWDFVCLEAAIRFDLSQAPDLLAWQDFEECLVKPARLDEKLEQNDVVPELRTSIALIEQIRQQAASETGPDPLPYYAGLLAWAVEAMARYDPGVLQTKVKQLQDAHLLLAACMIAGRLGTVSDTTLPEGQLRLDEDGRVWIGERRIATLAGLSQKLLTCLFEHEGQVVNNQMIIEAYEEKYVEGEPSQDQRIRQEISRLREEIEPDANHPHYILTERGKGYRLKVSGEPEK